MIEKERFWNPRDYKPRNSLRGPYLVVCALLKAFRCISPSYCSYCLTVYTPQYSLAYHSSLNRRYCGLKTFAVYVFDFSCPWKESTIQKKPVLCLTSLNRRLNHFEPIRILASSGKALGLFWLCNKVIEKWIGCFKFLVNFFKVTVVSITALLQKFPLCL